MNKNKPSQKKINSPRITPVRVYQSEIKNFLLDIINCFIYPDRPHENPRIREFGAILGHPKVGELVIKELVPEWKRTPENQLVEMLDRLVFQLRDKEVNFKDDTFVGLLIMYALTVYGLVAYAYNSYKKSKWALHPFYVLAFKQLWDNDENYRQSTCASQQAFGSDPHKELLDFGGESGKSFIREMSDRIIKKERDISQAVEAVEEKEYVYRRLIDLMIEQGEKTFNGLSFGESLTKALRPNRDIEYIPHAVSKDLKIRVASLYVRTKKGKAIKKTESVDLEISPESKDTFKDFIGDESLNPEELKEIVERENTISQVLEMMDDPAILTDRERKIMEMRYSGNKKRTLQEIADTLGIKKQNVNKTEKRAIKKISSQFKKRPVK